MAPPGRPAAEMGGPAIPPPPLIFQPRSPNTAVPPPVAVPGYSVILTLPLHRPATHGTVG